jgi:hypothetical protein
MAMTSLVDLLKRVDDFFLKSAGKQKGEGFLLLEECADALKRTIDTSRAIVQSKTTVTSLGDTFEDFWRVYPKRHGTNSKKDANTAWAAALKRGNVAGDIVAGAQVYALHCERDGILNTRMIMQAVRFIRSEEYQNQLSLSHEPSPDTTDRTAKANSRAVNGASVMASAFLGSSRRQSR